MSETTLMIITFLSVVIFLIIFSYILNYMIIKYSKEELNKAKIEDNKIKIDKEQKIIDSVQLELSELDSLLTRCVSIYYDLMHDIIVDVSYVYKDYYKNDKENLDKSIINQINHINNTLIKIDLAISYNELNIDIVSISERVSNLYSRTSISKKTYDNY